MVTDSCQGFSDSLLFLVGAQCLLLSERQWERMHFSVMRLTCGSIARVMMSSLDGGISWLTHPSTALARDSDTAHQDGREERERSRIRFNCHQIRFVIQLISADGWKWMLNIFAVKYCESKINVVSEAMTHIRDWCALLLLLEKHTFFFFCFHCWEPVTWSTAEHAKPESIQTIRQMREQACAASISDSYIAFEAAPSATHNDFPHSLFLPFLSEWLNLKQLWFSPLWLEVWQVYLFWWDCVTGKSLLVLSGADLLICVEYFAWQLPDSTVTQIACLRHHKQTL